MLMGTYVAMRAALGAIAGMLAPAAPRIAASLTIALAFLINLIPGLAAGAIGIWSGPFVVGRINPPDNPARLILTTDWRIAAFSLTLGIGVACLFGMAVR